MNKLSLAALALAPLAACSPGSLDGEVDGDAIPNFQSSFVFSADELSSDGDHVAGVAFFTFADSCEQMTAMADVKRKAIQDLFDGDSLEDVIDDVADQHRARLPDDFWAAFVMTEVSDADDVKGAHDVEEDGGVLVCHYTGAPDEDDFVAGLLPDYLPLPDQRERECFIATEGEVRFSFYDEEEAATLKGEVELSAMEDGDDAGDVEIGGIAGRCPTFRVANERHIDESIGLLAALADDDAAAASANDNTCRFANDGECDEPEGTDICDEGTDSNDCR